LRQASHLPFFFVGSDWVQNDYVVLAVHQVAELRGELLQLEEREVFSIATRNGVILCYLGAGEDSSLPNAYENAGNVLIKKRFWRVSSECPFLAPFCS
jgi:hypothetical protein